MKTLIRSFAAALFFAAVGAFATDPPQVLEKLPVGDETFFRKEGAKWVKIGNWRLNHIDENGVGQDLVGLFAYNFPIAGSDAEILTASRDFLQKHFRGETVKQGAYNVNLALPKYFQSHPKGTYKLRIAWRTSAEEPFYYATLFSYEVWFGLVQANGTWQPPASVASDMRMSFEDRVVMHFPSALRVRTRWLSKDSDGSLGFQDEPYFAEGSSLRPQSIRPKSTVENGIFSLPTEAMLGTPQGVLTVVYPNELFVRYNTRTGEKFYEGAEAREPIILNIQYRPADKWRKAGIFLLYSFDTEWGSNFIIEKSRDFKSWEVFPYEGEKLKEQGMFYRARYE